MPCFSDELIDHFRHQLSHWDSLILASAGEAGCGVVYTEDLNNGEDYGGIKAINPFG